MAKLLIKFKKQTRLKNFEAETDFEKWLECFKFYRRTEDAGWRYQSLDDFYYFGGQGVRSWYATTDHQVLPGMKNQIALKKGERLKVHGNHWNGFSKVYTMIA